MAMLIEHLERFCGPILHGASADPDGKKMPFQLIWLERAALLDFKTDP
jgi:hypothetical protein